MLESTRSIACKTKHYDNLADGDSRVISLAADISGDSPCGRG